MASESEGSKARAEDLLDRIRVWFLVKLNEPDQEEAAIKAIYDKWIDPDSSYGPNENLTVIRVDLVEVTGPLSCPFNLVVPVDALNESYLEEVIEDLNKIGQVNVAKVIAHYPEAPYTANGYISIPEAQLGIKRGPDYLPESLGLSRKSPGDNPWG
jgi:hypothetical protein